MKQPEIKEIAKVDLLKFEKRILANGLPMYIINAGKQELIKVDVLFDAGNAFSKDPVLASAVNALLNDGTTKHSSADIAKIIDGKGAFYTQDIQQDYSQTSMYLLSKFTKELMPLFLETLTDSVFPEHEVDMFKRNMKQRFLVEHEKVDVQSKQAFINALFGRDSIYADRSTAESYDALSRSEMLSFYSKRIKSSPKHIIVSGKVDNAIAESIARQFENIKLDYLIDPTEQIIYGDRLSAEEWTKIPGKNNQQVSMRIGMPSILPDHKDFLGLSLLTTILGGYFGSRLNKVIREEKGLTYGVHGHLRRLKHTSFLTIYAELNASNWEEAYDAIIDVFNDLKNNLVSDTELEMVRRYIKGSLLQSIDGAFQFSTYHRNTIVYNLKEDRINRYIQYLDQVKAPELKRLAQQYLVEKNFIKIIAGV